MHMAFANAAAGAAAAAVAESGAVEIEPPKEVPPSAMVPTPLFHVTANNCVLHPLTFLGAKLVLMHKWDPGRALELIEREQVATFTGVPTMSRELLLHPDWETRDTSSLGSMGGGGAALQPDLVEKISKAKGAVQPSTGYGLTETHGIITAVGNIFFNLKPTSAGRIMPTFDYKVVDEDGNPVPDGERGEFCVKGPAVVKGYLNRPEATAEAIVDGYFSTGDIVYVDDDGFVHIVDRAKDMVLRGGELCTAPRSRPPSTNTPTSPRPPCSVSRTSGWARPSASRSTSFPKRHSIRPGLPPTWSRCWPSSRSRSMSGSWMNRCHRTPTASS